MYEKIKKLSYLVDKIAFFKFYFKKLLPGISEGIVFTT